MFGMVPPVMAQTPPKDLPVPLTAGGSSPPSVAKLAGPDLAAAKLATPDLAAAKLAAPDMAGAKLAAPENTTPNTGVVQTSCSSCGGGLLGGEPGPVGGCSGCGGCGGCGSGQCVAGRLNCCSCCNAETYLGKMLCGFYNCICCPDPCYDPHWIPLADSALFVDAARPVTQMRLRWDYLGGVLHPDRAEIFLCPGEGGTNVVCACQHRSIYHL